VGAAILSTFPYGRAVADQESTPPAVAPPPAPNPHIAGWFNTLVPGGGRLLRGEPWSALGEAAVEVGTFGYGYHLSKRSPLTIDGVPEDYPAASPGTVIRTRHTVCVQHDPVTKKCTKVANSTSTSTLFDSAPVDLTRPIGAATLQEIGLKYHMVNVFETYQSALIAHGGDLGQGIETKSASELFMEPFRVSQLTNPWVYVPLILVAGYTMFDYNSQIKTGLTPTQRLTPASNRFVAFNQMVLYPIGSGAPEEMFYRGFVQNEAYYLTRSPWASVLVSSLAFAFSHSGDGRLPAGISGLYTGFLASHHDGKLGPGITLHFWSVLFLGIESYLLVKRSQAGGNSQPFGIQFSTPFSLR
jgi:membrane protease YdiL (CAAX protease family)